jgi:hypothetical protein
MLQGVTGVSQRCYKKPAEVLQGCSRGVTVISNLLQLERLVVEVLLQHLIREIDAQLLETVVLENLKT